MLSYQLLPFAYSSVNLLGKKKKILFFYLVVFFKVFASEQESLLELRSYFGLNVAAWEDWSIKIILIPKGDQLYENRLL